MAQEAIDHNAVACNSIAERDQRKATFKLQGLNHSTHSRVGVGYIQPPHCQSYDVSYST